MFKIRQIDHIVLRVVNIQAMLDFYINVIGCSLEKIQEGPGLYQVRAGSSLIDLIPVDGRLGKIGGAAPEKEGRNLDHFCLRIDPFDAQEILGYLRSKGIEPGNVESRYGAEGEGPSIYVTDPEGNVVELKGPPWEMMNRYILTKIYNAFNARDIDAVLTVMHLDVDWPNGWEGGRVYGHEGIRDYWTRQWAAIDPHVEPVGFDTDETGHTVVKVHQVVRDLSGNLISEGMVEHVYLIEKGLIKNMEIRKP